MELIISIVSITVLVAVVSFSYAFIKKDTKEEGYNLVGTNCIEIELKDFSPEINLKNAYPVRDEIGMNSRPYQFSLTNKCETDVTYQINLEIFNESGIEAKNIAVLLDDKAEKHVLGTDNDTATPIETDDTDKIKESHKIGTGSIRPYETVYHKVRIWLDENAGNDSQQKEFKCRIAIEAIQDEFAKYTEPLLHGADPVITGDLVAVKIEEDGTVIKADPNENWYSYENKQWANAVILNATGKTKTYVYGDEILESDIESYFVWIPKYSYKLFDLGNYPTVGTINSKNNQAVEIKFGLDNTVNSIDECEPPMNEDRTQGLSGESGNCEVGDYMTHPAFISFNVNGLWVGKFETSTPGNNKIEIKPNKSAWRSIAIGNSFTYSKNYKSELLSHMMKNTEWGAVAYLTQSIYGRCTKGDTTICSEISINDRVGYITGYTGANLSYPNSKDASTTGNNTGIYDMSGGSWEYMASTMYKSGNTLIDFGLSGLNSLEDKKYYDIYKYNGDETHWERRILGDATGELGSFGKSTDNAYVSSYFNDYAYFIPSNYPWICRGGDYENIDSLVGLFAFFYQAGNSQSDRTFRIVLAPR